MKNKIIVIVCFYWPFVFSCLQLQGVITYTMSENIAKTVAYLNVALVLGGIFFVKPYVETPSKTSRLWFIYFIMYYCFGLVAMGTSGF